MYKRREEKKLIEFQALKDYLNYVHENILIHFLWLQKITRKTIIVRNFNSLQMAIQNSGLHINYESIW